MSFIAAAAIAAGGAIAGGLIGASGAKSAANTQAGAARDATAAQKEIFERQVQLQEPWRQAGMAGLQRLNYLLGLSPGPAGATVSPTSGGMLVPGADGVFAPAGQTEAEIRARLTPQFTTTTPDRITYSGDNDTPTVSPGSQTLDSAGLNAAVQAEMARQAAASTPATGTATTPAPTDPAFGSLMRDFGMSDFQADPGYAFRLSEGEKAQQRAKAASGSLGSGKYLKDLTDYSQGMASQEFGNAFNRYQANRGFKINALQSLAGLGQSSANTLTGAAGTLGGQIGSNIIGAGNAAAAGQIGTANALTGALGQGVSMYQQNQLLQRYPPPTYYSLVGGGGGFGTGNAWGNLDYGLNF
jgi:hypothetical protein